MKRIVEQESNLNEADFELSLRPQYLNEYIGQERITKNLEIFIKASLYRDEALDHILLYGPPGLGKTTLAYVIANEMHSKLHVINGPSIEKIGDLATVLSELEPGDVLFIDEIHRIPKTVEESLYTAMEDFKFSVVINRDTNSSILSIDLPPFTLVGATTKPGSLSSPLRDRFGIVEKLQYYTLEELKNIVIRTARVFNSTIDNDAAYEIAKRSRGTPRISNRILKRVRDFANYENRSEISYSDAISALDALRIDSIGLDEVDIKYLQVLINRFGGGPVGLETLADAIGEEKENLEDVYEPYLLKLGFIDRTPKGRVATKQALSHLKCCLKAK